MYMYGTCTCSCSKWMFIYCFLSFFQDAIAAGQFYPQVLKLQRGDVQAAFAAAHGVVEGTTRSGGQEHFYLETHATIAIPKKENGEMELITSSQSLSQTQLRAARALGVPANRIVVRAKRLGKLSIHTILPQYALE